MQDFSLFLQMDNGPSPGIRYVGRGSDSTNDKGAPETSPGTLNSLVDSAQDFFRRNLADDWGCIAIYLHVAVMIALCIVGVLIYFNCVKKKSSVHGNALNENSDGNF